MPTLLEENVSYLYKNLYLLLEQISSSEYELLLTNYIDHSLK